MDYLCGPPISFCQQTSGRHLLDDFLKFPAQIGLKQLHNYIVEGKIIRKARFWTDSIMLIRFWSNPTTPEMHTQYKAESKNNRFEGDRVELDQLSLIA